MKKLLSQLMAAAIAIVALPACEDVPAPYPTPTPTPAEEVTYKGNGTLESPYTCADAITYCQSLDGAESETAVYVKGIVASVTEEFTTQYGNGTFTISDDGTTANVFTAYRVLYLGNKKFTSGKEQIKVGDEVIVYGQVVNYRGNTPETVQGSAYLYSLNGVTDGGGSSQPTNDDAKGSGTLSDPYNAAAAIALAQQTGESESADVYIKGRVAAIAEQFGTQYGNATFTISDDGSTASTTFTIYRAYYLGNKKYTSGDLLKEGDEVVIYGKVTNFRGNTPETVTGKAFLYSLNGKTEGGNEGGGGDTPDPQPSGEKYGTLSGNTLTLVSQDMGIDNGAELGTITLVDGTTIAFADGGNSNAPKYYVSGTSIRMYPKNTMTVKASGKTVSTITLTCSEQSGTLCNASEQLSITAGSLAFSGSEVQATAINAATVTIANENGSTGAASQLRFTKLVITYKE